MIKFRQKIYTIQEGHYTGPKDLEEIPGVINVIGKSTLIGTGIGAAAGSILKDTELLKDTGLLNGAKTGGKIGFISGVLMKIIINILHNPMSSIKYQEVDRLIRRDFGIYRVSGITVGDSKQKKLKLEEKFAFNDREITSYKINVSIQDNKVTLYTLGMTDKELKSTSDILDYYCKKYFGMEYTSKVINEKTNSYSVSIVFTNYQIISNFLIELSDTLNVKINLLDNKALVDNKISSDSEKEKQFSSSLPLLDKYDLIKIFGNATIKSIPKFQDSPKLGVSSIITGVITDSFELQRNSVKSTILSKLGIGSKRRDLNNKYLEKCLKRLGYIENINYTVGDLGSPLNIYLLNGIFMICVKINTTESNKIEQLNKLLSLNKTEFPGKAYLYVYPIKSELEFNTLLKKLFSFDIVPNLYTK